MKVEFNQKVDKTSAEKLTNYYVGIGEINVTDSSIEHNNPNLYQAKLQKDGKTVIISAATGKENTQVIWLDKNTKDDPAGSGVYTAPVALKVNGTDFVVKDKTVTIQVRNVKDADNKLMDTQEKSFKSVDLEAAKIYGTVTSGTPAVVTRAENNVTEVIVTSDKDVLFMFDEPVFVGTGVQFYLDSKNITLDSSDNPLVLLDLATDPSGKTLKVKKEAGIKDLTLGDHKFAAVGIEDLAGNKPVGDIYNAVIKVVEPKESEDTSKAPEVLNVKQTEEGKFVVTFKAAPKVGTIITVKDSEGNTVKSLSTLAANATQEVVFATAIAEYKGNTKLIYTVEVTGADGGKIEAAVGDKKADKYSKVHTFQLDLVAPKVVYSTKDADGKVIDTIFVKSTALGKIVIPFADELFGGSVVKGTAANAVILKQHIDEETKTLTIPFANIAALVSNDLTIDVADLVTNGTTQAIKDAATAMLNKDKDALVAGEYELILPRGLVEDTKGGVAGSKRISDNTTIIPFAGDTLRFEVKDAGQGGGVASVPQTAQNLVTYDSDHDAITVEFVGSDIKIATAKNPANYTLAGAKLAADTVIEYETLKNASDEVTGGKARIFLNKDTVALTGNYTLKVEGVSTNSGAKMLPVSVTVSGMQDNTRPVLESAVITGDAKLELRFSESVTIQDANLAAGNFEVLVNGERYNVKDAIVHTTNTRLVILTLNDTIDYVGKTIIVRTKADDNTDYFVRDLSNNELKAGVIVTATVKGE